MTRISGTNEDLLGGCRETRDGRGDGDWRATRRANRVVKVGLGRRLPASDRAADGQADLKPICSLAAPTDGVDRQTAETILYRCLLRGESQETALSAPSLPGGIVSFITHHAKDHQLQKHCRLLSALFIVHQLTACLITEKKQY